MTAVASRAVLDEIEVWVDAMRHVELLSTPSPRTGVAELVASGLAAHSDVFVSSPVAVGEPIDRIASLSWSAGSPNFAEWDSQKASDIGKQELRGDAIALLAGIGVGINTGASGDALIAAATDEYLAHLERQGNPPNSRERNTAQRWAHAAIGYLADPDSAVAAAARPDLLGSNE
jgi:hypothetical protein